MLVTLLLRFINMPDAQATKSMLMVHIRTCVQYSPLDLLLHVVAEVLYHG